MVSLLVHEIGESLVMHNFLMGPELYGNSNLDFSVAYIFSFDLFTFGNISTKKKMFIKTSF